MNLHPMSACFMNEVTDTRRCECAGVPKKVATYVQMHNRIIPLGP